MSDHNTFFYKISLNMIPYWILGLSYALVVFSTPMPVNPGWVEVIMGMGLMSSCLLLAQKIYKSGLRTNRAFIMVLLVMSYLVIIPLITGILNRHDARNIFRDLAPALFLIVIPLVVKYSLKAENAKHIVQILLSAVLFVGVVSAIHSLIWVHDAYGSFNNFILQMSGNFEKAGKLVLAKSAQGSSTVESVPQSFLQLAVVDSVTRGFPNDFKSVALLVYEPAVLFAAIYSLLTTIETLFEKKLVRVVPWLIAAAICIYALSVWGSRASVLLTLFAGLLFAVRYIKFTLRAIPGLLIGGGVVAILGLTMFSDAINMLLVKQHSVGTNGKVAEFIAVVEQSKSSVYSFLFGGGWGEELNNPVYISAPTRFTHSLISFFLLKVGIVGLAAFVWLYARSFWGVVTNIVCGHTSIFTYKVLLASLSVLVVGLILQPTYKMLGFSIILAILSACVIRDSSKNEYGE